MRAFVGAVFFLRSVKYVAGTAARAVRTARSVNTLEDLDAAALELDAAGA